MSPFDIAPAEDYFSGAWSNIFDVCTPDGEISLLDFVIFARNYGKTEPEQIVYSIEGTITPYFELSDSFHERALNVLLALPTKRSSRVS
ncbi:hypothetical protein [Mesotoga sp.]|uniref:hypothetical protein n=1 Tax=Mesotoga sp. TaxID=2053577 RepID=UPI00345E928E